MKIDFKNAKKVIQSDLGNVHAFPHFTAFCLHVVKTNRLTVVDVSNMLNTSPRPLTALLQSGGSGQRPLCICSSGFLFNVSTQHYNKVFPLLISPSPLTIMYQIFKYYHVRVYFMQILYMSMMSVLYVSAAVKYF